MSDSGFTTSAHCDCMPEDKIFTHEFNGEDNRTCDCGVERAHLHCQECDGVIHDY
jgi:hypothetical protein